MFASMTMRALALLCLLHAALAQDMDFSWNGPVETTPSAEPNLGPACSAGQSSCGCCLMQKQVRRMDWFFNHTVEELNKHLMKSKTCLNNLRASRSAFSVSLNNERTLSCFDPFDSDRVIIYKHVFINLGDGYDIQTGIFTAPRSGVYSLAVSIYGPGLSGRTQSTCADLQVNGKDVAGLFEKAGQDNEDSNTAVIAVQLQAGDQVTVNLRDGCIVCDDINHFNTFTGFLLYSTDKM